MPFRVIVRPLALHGCVQPEPPTDEAEYQAWLADDRKHVLVNVPLGGGSDVCSHWSGPALQLCLPLIASIYDWGLEVEGDELDALDEELAQLVQHWMTAGVDDGEMAAYVKRPIPLIEDLLHRSDLLEVAIQVAKVAPGYLYIVTGIEATPGKPANLPQQPEHLPGCNWQGGSGATDTVMTLTGGLWP